MCMYVYVYVCICICVYIKSIAGFCTSMYTLASKYKYNIYIYTHMYVSICGSYVSHIHKKIIHFHSHTYTYI